MASLLSNPKSNNNNNDSKFNDLTTFMTNTLSPEDDVRKHATLSIQELSKQIGFSVALIQIIENNNTTTTNNGTRLASATYLKNFIKKNWNKTLTNEEEQEQIKTAVLNALLRVQLSDRAIRSLFAECFRLISIQEFPEKWKNLEITLSETLKQALLLSTDNNGNNNLSTLSNVVLATYQVCKRYEFFQKVSHGPKDVPSELDSISNLILPSLINNVFVVKCTTRNEKDNDLLRMIAKLFFRITRSYMPTICENLAPIVLLNSMNVLNEINSGMYLSI